MPKRTGRPWSRIKAQVIRRDGGRCHLCFDLGADTADHLIPVAHGGPTYDLTNLAAAHQPCNLRRGTRDIEVVRAEIAAERTRLAVDATAWSW